jgi:hypothetical protein
LFSIFLNASSKYYCNIRLHLLACLRAFGSILQNRASRQQQLRDQAVGKQLNNTLPVSWLQDVKLVNLSLPMNDFKNKIIGLLLKLPSDLLSELTIIVYTYFLLLFQNSLYKDVGFTKKYLDSLYLHVQKRPEELSRIEEVINQAKTDPIIHAEICTIGDNIHEQLLQLVTPPAENDGSLSRDRGEDEEEEFHCRFESNDAIREFINDLFVVNPKKLFYRKLADESLSPANLRQYIADIRRQAEILCESNFNANLVVFIDELNTAGALGMVTELFLSHSLDGERLPQNIFFVGAINPFRLSTAQDRAKSMNFLKIKRGESTESTHDEDDYLANAPYIVKELSLNLFKLLVEFEDLSPDGEVRFLSEYFRIQIQMPCPAGINEQTWNTEFGRFAIDAITTITTAQAEVRKFDLPRIKMSIRNLIRSVEILKSLIDGRFYVPTRRQRNADSLNAGVDPKHIFLPKERNFLEGKLIHHLQFLQDALTMTIAVGYMFQLPSAGHAKNNSNLIDYRSQLVLALPNFIQDQFSENVKSSLEHLISYIDLPKGLAKTDALMENFYAVTLTTMLRVPLLITGPPGIFL